MISEVLKTRHQAALVELEKLVQDHKDYPINYNHYYTDIVHQKRQDRIKAKLAEHFPEAPVIPERHCSAGNHYAKVDMHQELERIVKEWGSSVTADMEEFSCQEALDCLLAIYKASLEPFP
jgi:hypothetical protein